MLKLFNTLTREIEEFKPIKDKEVGIYSCGPTIYNFAHIGNFRAYIVSDLLKRYLKYKGYKVKHIMNLTDVDDKTIRDSQKEHLPLKEFTDKYAKAFFEDIKTLNIEPADVFPRATDYIQEMVQLIKKLIEKGFAYKGEDGSIYYDISKFKDYGKLAHINLEELQSGASGRVKKDEYAKEQAHDFALWKAWDKEDGDVFWETDIGKGRPGWHIECSVMSTKNLGEIFDIHTGGVDLIFPHHQNEIAQSEAATGKRFVNYWMHNEWLLVEGKKMSKSLGNFLTLRDLLAKGCSPKAIRYTLLSTHYRQQQNFTFDEVKAAESTVGKLTNFMDCLKAFNGTEDNKKVEELIFEAKRKFEESMDDDLDISKALAAIFELLKDINILMAASRMSRKDAEESYLLMSGFDKVLGVISHKAVEENEIPEKVKVLMEEREFARARKNWGLADTIRNDILKMGWQIVDTAEGPRAKKQTSSKIE